MGKCHLYQILDIWIWWRNGGDFARRLRHSHGRNFGPIFFKFGHDAALDHPVFAIESQQKSVSNFRFYEEPRIGLRMFLAKNSRQNQNFPTLNEVLLSINSDLLNTNLIIIWGFKISLLI